MNTETIILAIAALILGVSFIIFLVRYLKKKEKVISIEVNNCSECIFRNKKDGMIHYTCRLQNLVSKDENKHYKELEDMKLNCPVEGRLEILIKKL